MQANITVVSGWRRQWWTQGLQAPRAQGPRVMEAEILPQPQASGSSCQLLANRAHLWPSKCQVDGKDTVMNSHLIPDVYLLCDLRQIICLL